MSSEKAPGLSGMETERRASLFSPRAARSATKRSRSKFMFAPEAMATKMRSRSSDGCEEMYFLRPATASAPAGSTIDRVSSNTSFMAAQISSVVTWMISSTTSWQRRKVSCPTFLTAAPSAKRPTSLSATRLPAARDWTMAFASRVSTPMILTWGAILLTYTPTPDMRPPPPTQTNIASSLGMLVCRKISIPIVPCPAMTYGSSNGGMFINPCSSSKRRHSTLAASKSGPCRLTTPPSLDTLRCLMLGVPFGITIVAGILSFLAEYATP